MSNKPGRNDPCHCGSGKKYKKCCLRADEHKVSKEELKKDAEFEAWFQNDLLIGQANMLHQRFPQPEVFDFVYAMTRTDGLLHIP